MSEQPKDGGFAYPFGQISEQTGQPINGYFSPGMTLRDYFAGQALAGLAVIAMANTPEPIPAPDVAHVAFVLADAMLAARTKATPAKKDEG